MRQQLRKKQDYHKQRRWTARALILARDQNLTNRNIFLLLLEGLTLN